MIEQFRPWVMLVIAGAILALGSAGSASAKLPGSMPPCGSVDEAVEREDGSFIILARTTDCGYREGVMLLGLSPDGKLLGSFGNGGLNRIPNGKLGTLLARPDGGVIVLSGSSLVAYDGNGQPDTGFAEDGKLTRPVIRTATIGADGYLYVLWGEAQWRLEKFDLDGTPDPGFGENGEIQVPAGRVGPAVDSQGRVLFGHWHTVTRLLPDGTPDASYDGDGEVEVDVNPVPPEAFYSPGAIARIETVPDDGVQVFGPGSIDLYSNPFFVGGTDSAGEQAAGMPTYISAANLSSISRVGSGFAYSLMPLRDDPDQIRVFDEANWAAPAELSFTKSRAGGEIHDILPLADGSLLAGGFTYGTICPGGRCRTADRIALAKFDPSGKLDVAFGRSGKVVLPEDSCRFGAGNTKGDWKSCRVRAPRLKGRVKLSGARSGRPSLLVRTRLGQPPVVSGQISQRLVLTLPRWMSVRQRKLKASKAVATPRTKVDLAVRGRKLTVTLARSSPVNLKIRIPRGAIKLRRKSSRLRIPVRAAFIPGKESIDSPNWTIRRLPVRLASRGPSN